jgi:hypothetical protein
VLIDQSLPGMAPADRQAIYGEMNRVIAALHRVDIGAAGLADFGRAGNYFGRQIARWTRQYRESSTGEIPAMERLMEWLPQSIPVGDETVIVHGDFRLDNLVFHPSEPRVIGVLDWELSTLGHPLADFSYHCMSWHIPPDLWRGIAGLDLPRLGIPSEAEYVRRYSDGTGRDASADWDFYLAYNLFRMAAILQGIAMRARSGNAASSDAEETGEKPVRSPTLAGATRSATTRRTAEAPPRRILNPPLSWSPRHAPNPDCQSRRDRVPSHSHMPPNGHRSRRDPLADRCRCSARPTGRCGGSASRRRPTRWLREHRGGPRGLSGKRCGRRPPRLRIPS